MSAFVVSKAHIDALITAGLDLRSGPMGSQLRWFHHDHDSQWGELDHHNTGYVGAMLWAENQRSVNHRYSEDEIEEPYEYERYTLPLPPVTVLKAIACYEYQSCEHSGWRTSEARAFCDALRIRTIGRLPGWGEAPWELSHHATTNG